MIDVMMVKHRGRHQAQGHDVAGGDRSRPWARPLPYPALDAHDDLTGLEGDLNPAAREKRVLSFRQAHRFVDNAKQAGGIGPTARTFPAGRPGEDTDARVDIEVKKGLAFT